MMQVEKIKPTGLFTNYIYKAIPLAFDESMSYYETLCGLLSYLKDTVIPTLNNNADAIVEVQDLMEKLQTYVDNYFKNLDVQNEINNKLDQMASDGELEQIITLYLQFNSILSFNNVNEMVSSNKLINGSTAKTLGYYNINDGGGSLYKIREKTDSDTISPYLIQLNNNLVAELISNKKLYLEQFGIKDEENFDCTTLINSAIKYCVNNGVETITFNIANKNYYVASSIIIPTGIVFDGNNCTLKGNQTEACILSGYIDDNGDLIANTDKSTNESSYSNYRITSHLKNIKFINCLVAIKLNTFVYGSTIENCYFDISNSKSIVINNGWGSSILDCKFYAPVELRNFCDWFTVKGNSFEQSNSDNGLIIQYSQSMRVVSNGFHSLKYGIELQNNVYDTIIKGNHFEENQYALFAGSNAVLNNLSINNNWIKCSSSAVTKYTNIYGLWLNNLINSNTSNNYFDESSANFTKKITTTGSSRGNIIETMASSKTSTPNNYDMPSTEDYNTNGIIRNIFTNINVSNNQPSLLYSDSNGYTFEKYISKYNMINNNIPFTEITSSSANVKISTQIPCNTETFNDKVYVNQPAICWFDFLSTDNKIRRTDIVLLNGESNYLINGSKTNSNDTTSTPITYTFSNNNNKLDLILTGFATDPANVRVRGFIKML